MASRECVRANGNKEQTVFNDLRQGPRKEKVVSENKFPLQKEKKGVPLHFEIIVRKKTLFHGRGEEGTGFNLVLLDTNHLFHTMILN